MGETEKIEKAFIPVSRVIKLSFGEFEIKPLTVRQILRIFKFLKPMQIAVLKSAENLDNSELIFKLIDLLGNDFPEVLKILLNKSELTVNDITINEAAILGKAISEVNDFEELRQNFSAAISKKKSPETA